jgi:hypothetical protein
MQTLNETQERNGDRRCRLPLAGSAASAARRNGNLV